MAFNARETQTAKPLHPKNSENLIQLFPSHTILRGLIETLENFLNAVPL